MSPAPSRDEIAAALRASTEPGLESHLEIDEIFAYHSGSLDAERFERAQSHLLVCRRCLDDLLDLETFVGLGAEHDESAEQPTDLAPGDFEVASAWQSLRSRLARPRSSSRFVLPLAASLLVAVLGLAWALLQQADADATVEALREEVARLETPQPDARIIDLAPASGTRGEGADAPRGLPATSGFATLVLRVPEPVAGGDSYAVEIVDADGRQVWAGALRMEELGLLSLALPGSFLAPGEYRLLVSVDLAGDRRFLESYPLRVLSTPR